MTVAELRKLLEKVPRGTTVLVLGIDDTETGFLYSPGGVKWDRARFVGRVWTEEAQEQYAITEDGDTPVLILR